MMRILKFAVLLLCLNVIPAHADDDVLVSAGACADQFTNSAGYVVPKPFSSTICPQDKALQLAIYHFPATMETMVNILDLSKKSEIIESIKTADADEVTQQNYGNEILNIERASMELQELALLIAKIMIGVQVMIAAFIALKDGEFGGKTFGGFKTAMSFGLGILLITPIPIYTSLMDKTVDVLVIQMLMGGITIAAIGAANIVISTAGFIVMNDLPDERDKSFSDLNADDNLMSIPLTKSRVFIEDAICQNQSALLGVYEGAYKDFASSNESLTKIGKSYQYSPRTDGYSTWAEFGESPLGISIQKGTNLDEVASAGQAPKECSFTTIRKPSWKPETEESSQIITSIDMAVDGIAFKDLGSREKLQGEWVKLQTEWLTLLEELLGGVDADNKAKIERELFNAANYFYDSVAYRAVGGALLNQETDALELYNERARLADQFAKTLMGQRCYIDREGYIRSKGTVRALKSGKIGSSDFSLKCATIDESGARLAFDAKSDSATEFASSTLSLHSESVTNLQSIYVALYRSIEGLELNIEYARNRSLSAVTKTVFYKDEGTAGRSVGAQGVAMRIEGFASFAHMYTALLKSLHSVFVQTAKEKIRTVYSSPESVVVSYSSQDAYLPRDSSELKKDFQSDKIEIPEFVFATPSGKTADVNDYESKVISSIESQFTTNQGGTYNAKGRANSNGVWDDGQVASEIGLMVSDGVQGVTQAGVSTVVKKIINNFALASVSKNDEEYYEFDTIKHNEVLKSCGKGLNQSELAERLGEDGVDMYNMICPNYIMHPVFKNQEVGRDVVKYSIIGLVAVYGSRFTAKAEQWVSKKRKKNAEKQVDGGLKSGKKGKDNQVGSKASESQSKSNSKDSFLRKTMQAVGGIALNDLAYTIMTLSLWVFLILGFIMSVVTPMIPILTYMFSYLGWAILFVQLMVISAFVALTLFVVSPEKGDGAAKSFVGVFINLFIRPFAMIVGFVVAYVITYLSFMVFDMTMVNIVVGIGGSGDNVFFNPFEILLDGVLLLVVWMAHLFIIKTVFEICLKAPNTIVEKFGAETLDARESQISNMAYAAASSVTEQNTSVSNKMEERHLDNVISESNKAHYKYMEESARAAAAPVGRAFSDAGGAVSDALSSNNVVEKMKAFSAKKDSGVADLDKSGSGTKDSSFEDNPLDDNILNQTDSEVEKEATSRQANAPEGDSKEDFNKN